MRIDELLASLSELNGKEECEHEKIISLLEEISDEYRKMGDKERALKYRLMLARVALKNCDKCDLRAEGAYRGVAQAYAELCDYERAIFYYKKLLSLLTSLNLNAEVIFKIAQVYMRLAQMNKMIGNSRAEIEYLLMAVRALENELLSKSPEARTLLSEAKRALERARDTFDEMER